mgnify:CR=1 FL=1
MHEACELQAHTHTAPQYDALAALLMSDKAHLCFDQTDHKDLEKDVKIKHAKQAAAKEFIQKFTEKSREISFALAKELEGSRKKRKSHAVVQVPVPIGIPSQEEAKSMIPPNSSILRSTKCQGWCGHAQPYHRSYYSGIFYVHRGSFMFNLRDMWTKHLVTRGLPESACPVMGLLSDDYKLPGEDEAAGEQGS